MKLYGQALCTDQVTILVMLAIAAARQPNKGLTGVGIDLQTCCTSSLVNSLSCLDMNDNG
jgi:hypothetical protein